MATLVPTRKEWQQRSGESFDRYMNRLDMLMKTFPRPTQGQGTVGCMIQFHTMDNYARYVIVSESPFQIELFPWGDAYQMPTAFVRGLLLEDVAPWRKATPVAVKEFIYETVIRCGRMKNYRILNLSTGTLYSMDFDTLAAAIRGIEDGTERSGKIVKYVPLQNIVGQLWTL